MNGHSLFTRRSEAYISNNTSYYTTGVLVRSYFRANISTRVQRMCADGCAGAENKMLIELDVRETVASKHGLGFRVSRALRSRDLRSRTTSCYSNTSQTQ